MRITRWIRPDARTIGLVAALALMACGDVATAPEAVPAADTSPEFATTGGTWTARAPLPSARQQHAAAVVTNASGQTIMYVLGGYSGSNVVLRDNLAYNPGTNTWTARAPMPARRRETNGAAAINGKVYVSGGYNSLGERTNTLFVYDPATNTWATRAPLPDRMAKGAMVAYGGKLYVLASRYSDCTGCTTETARFYRYDPATNSWTRKANAPNQRWAPAGAVINGKLYVAGGDATGADFGWDTEADLDIYDFATNTWRKGAPRFSSSPAAAALNGKLYLIGKDVARYDPATNTWATMPYLPLPRNHLAAATVARNGVKVIIAAGGRRNTGWVTYANVDQYTP